ncbi:MAG: hypothetical protein IKS45_07120, partial [Thermoguttaceae bacterium]|nr:hypothetical protein [Thermoguttaceae bacterium]
YDFDKKYIVNFAKLFLSDVDNRMIVDGRLPSETINLKLGEELDDSFVEFNELSPSDADLTPPDFPSNSNFESLIKKSENLDE